MKEYQIQIKLINYLKSKKLSKFRFFHVPNQGVRSIKQKLLLASMGMKSGCPDLILEFKGGRIVYVEIKANRGTLTRNQRIWQLNSRLLKTPHYILKGELNGLIKQLNIIITKHY